MAILQLISMKRVEEFLLQQLIVSLQHLLMMNTYDEFDQLIKLSNSKDQSFEYEYDAQGDRTRYKKNINDPYDADAWYKYLEETPYDEVKDLLEDKNSMDTFDALRYQAKYHKDNNTCVGDGGIDENDRIASKGNYIIDKSLDNSEILMSRAFIYYTYNRIEKQILFHAEEGKLYTLNLSDISIKYGKRVIQHIF